MHNPSAARIRASDSSLLKAQTSNDTSTTIVNNAYTVQEHQFTVENGVDDRGARAVSCVKAHRRELCRCRVVTVPVDHSYNGDRQ